jgi:hypothetical protein
MRSRKKTANDVSRYVYRYEMNKLLSITLILLSFYSTQAFSVCTARSCSNVTIDNLYITTTGNTLVITSGDEANLNCTGTDGKYMTLVTTDSNSKAVFAALLAARTTDKPVSLRVNEGSVGCTVQRIEYGKDF